MTKVTDLSNLPPLDSIFNAIRPIIIEGGQIALNYFNNPEQINREIKPDQSIVTNADIAVSELLVRELQHYTPHIPVVSEESKSHRLDDPNGAYWLLDPIDGTSYFSNLTDGWTVLASLQNNKEQLFGLAYSPLRDTFYYASKGHGAFKQIGNDTPTQIIGKKWSKDESLVPISQAHYPDGALKDMQFLEAMGYTIGRSDASQKINRFTAVAEGDGHFALGGYGRSGPKEWDLATHIIISESGGKTFLLHASHEIEFGKPNREFRHVMTVSDTEAADKMIAHLTQNPLQPR